MRLGENAGIAFIGCYVLGMGFVLDPDEAQAWIAEDPRNAEVLFPYLNGEDLNSRPDCSRIPCGLSTSWPELQVRLFLTPTSRYERGYGESEFDLQARYANQQAERCSKMVAVRKRRRSAMRRAIADLDEVLVIARVSKT